MRLTVFIGFIFLQLFAVFAVGAGCQYFDIPVSPGDEESCPSPRDIKNNHGVFRSLAKSEGVEWVGVLPGEGLASVVAFEKAIFVLAEENSETRGFLSSCIYATSEGKYLSMRLNAGNKHDDIMWVVRSSSWRISQDFSSKKILECSDKSERACGFFLK